MVIHYVHISDPKKVKVYYPHRSFEKLKQTGFYHGQTLEEWAEHEKEKFKQDKEKGIIIYYQIIE